MAVQQFRAMARGHAEALLPMITTTMAAAGAAFADLEAIGVTVGPGAFTGIRIGLAAARGLGLATGLPVLGVTTFAAVAEAIPAAVRDHRPVLVVLDSKRRDVFSQLFDANMAPDGAPFVAPAANLVDRLPSQTMIVAGDGVPLLRTELGEAPAGLVWSGVDGPVDAAHVASLAVRLRQIGATLPPTPIYLRAPAVN